MGYDLPIPVAEALLIAWSRLRPPLRASACESLLLEERGRTASPRPLAVSEQVQLQLGPSSTRLRKSRRPR